jgi:hypothetical protein
MTEKILIFDAGPLIGFTMNGLLPELKKLKEIFPGKFIITKEVKEEIIDRPITIKRFELEALKLQELINDRTLEFPESLGINEEKISKETKELIDIANNTMFERGKPIHLIDKGETSALILSKILNEENKKNILVVDERTTRMLCEKPENLRKLLQKKLHSKIEMKKQNLTYFQGFKIIRSTELAYLIHKKNLTSIKNTKILDALLYALKYKGCAISREEIDAIKKLAN